MEQSCFDELWTERANLKSRLEYVTRELIAEANAGMTLSSDAYATQVFVLSPDGDQESSDAVTKICHEIADNLRSHAGQLLLILRIKDHGFSWHLGVLGQQPSFAFDANGNASICDIAWLTFETRPFSHGRMFIRPLPLAPKFPFEVAEKRASLIFGNKEVSTWFHEADGGWNALLEMTRVLECPGKAVPPQSALAS